MTYDTTDAANDEKTLVQQTRERATWLDMQRDEAHALDRQQVSAGGAHSPVEGPGPYGDHGVNMAVELAIRAERERCVGIVRAWADQCERTHRPIEAGLARSLADTLELPPPVPGGSAPGSV